ncbi:MAG: gliding motility-associated C-terminal domain-containing protein [Flavobacteriales bacterium]
MRFFLVIIILFFAFSLKATHNRGGEITYTHISGNTYKFTITTCTKTSAPADREELEIIWGDGSKKDTVSRSSKTFLTNDSQKNYYIINHTFAGAGTFRVTVEDPNRNGGIVNIGGSTNSDQFPFCIATEIVISPFLGINNSVDFSDCPCPEFACVNKRYCYNPQAVDLDGDSLSYALVPCLGVGCNPMVTPAVYQYPSAYGGTISIDPISGTMCWVNPTRLGEYNIAILITEWRNGIKIGSVLRDIQLTVINCTNDPPVIDSIKDTCVVAGSTISFSVSATDVNAGDVITLSASGAPFTGVTNPASFPSVSGLSPVTSTFSWNTNCSNIRRAPFPVYFVAKDNASPVSLSDYKQMNIIVKAPAPTGVVATPLSGTVTVKWNVSQCSNAIGYKVYRKKGSSSGSLDCCNQSSPLDLGYTFVGQTNSLSDTSFVDASTLAVGEEYCYVVTAIFPVDYESCISNQSCVKLKKDVPIITHVTVNSTNSASGIDSIRWIKPTEIDTITNYPPPYLYRVFQSAGFTGASTLIYTTPTYSQLYLSDTIYTHNSINTEDNPNNYQVKLYHIVGPDTLIVGSTNTASSIYLASVPSDNKITLSWSETVPWTNTSYEVYKGNSIGGIFTLLGTTSAQTFVDSNLTNGSTYCYKVKSIGNYSDPSIASPIENFSQEICDSPVDLTPPCPPVLTIDNNCEDELNYLSWTNPNNSCADDVTRYKVYYAPTAAGPYVEIAIKSPDTDTTHTHNYFGSIAGCYYITALDSIQYNNESLPSNIVCVDNCPIYFLPNVFTPDGDGINDKFTPLLPYKFIDSIEFLIYNRWGNVVFRTDDPMLNWDGTDQESGEPVVDGVYFYVCRVYSIRLTGLDETELKGSISVYRGEGRKN